MTNSVTLHMPWHSSNDEKRKYMQDVLANTYGLYLATHNYHWNVEGAEFLTLHKLFEKQYLELFEAIDVIGERIRAIGDYALPFEGEDILRNLKMVSNALNKEQDANDRAIRMVHNLIGLQEELIKSCQIAKDEACDIDDDETENLMVERITAHQKQLWMLKSVIKSGKNSS
jgi:starvation-inducible DNA-binding protein